MIPIINQEEYYKLASEKYDKNGGRDIAKHFIYVLYFKDWTQDAVTGTMRSSFYVGKTQNVIDRLRMGFPNNNRVADRIICGQLDGVWVYPQLFDEEEIPSKMKELKELNIKQGLRCLNIFNKYKDTPAKKEAFEKE